MRVVAWACLHVRWARGAHADVLSTLVTSSFRLDQVMQTETGFGGGERRRVQHM